jgi:iron-sulfur cluster repair protein YtfE (RIC family)
MDLDLLRKQHDVIAMQAADLFAAVSSREPKPVAAIRWRLARDLMAHLALEDRWLYPSMMRSDENKAAITAARFQNEMGDLAAQFTAYMASWTDLRLVEDWDAFCVATRTILSALAARIQRENQELYPLVPAKSGPVQAKPARRA